MRFYQIGDGVSHYLKMAFSPDGRVLGLAGGGEEIHFLDTFSGDLRSVRLPDGLRSFYGLAYTVAGLAIQTLEGHILVYDSDEVQPRHRMMDAKSIALAAPPDGRTLFVVRNPEYPEVARWDVSTFTELLPFGKHKGHTEHLTVAADGSRAAIGGGAHARVWSLTGKSMPKRAMYHIRMRGDGWVKSLSLSGDGSVLAAAARNQVIAWDVNADVEKFQHTRHRRAVNTVALNPTQPILVSGGNDGLAFVYDSKSGKEVCHFNWNVGSIIGLAFAPDGLRCAASSATGNVIIWDMDV